MRWPGYWPTRTCGFARRRSSSWPAGAKKGGRRSPGSPGLAKKTLPRIHAIWGLGQAGRTVRDGRRTSQWSALEPLLADPDPEVRAQAAKVVGDAKEPKSFEALVGLLDDASPRVRFFAAIALGKLGRSEAAGPLLKLLRANADNDPYLRHAGVMGLVGSGKSDTWTKAAHDESPAARMGALLAMRRHEDPAIAGFLNDPDPRFVLEAARAINDVPITAALPGLAGVRLTSSATLPLLRRALNANFRLGRAEHAAVLAESAARSDLPAGARVLALGDAGHVEEAVGARSGDGPLAADSATSVTAGRRRAAAQAGRRSWLRPL